MSNPGLCESAHDGNPYNIVRLLKACTATKDLHKGSKMHEYVREHGYLGKNMYIGNTLISMYAKCGALTKAHQVLKELSARDVVSWNALIAGQAQQGQGGKALKCFEEMVREGYPPDAVTFSSVLKACGNIRATAKGKEIHDKVVSLGMLENDVVLGAALVDMYAKCGELLKAQQLLKELPVCEVDSWNALIAGYSQRGHGEEALKCFDAMLCEGHYPDAVTFACILKACGAIGAAAKGKEIHDKVNSLGMLEKDIVLGNTLVDMYAKCGELARAQRVLKELPMCDVVSWNALIAGYTQHGQGEEALKCFNDMLREGQSPDSITFNCVLNACGSIGASVKGEEIHDKIMSFGMLEKDIVLGMTLVNMYAKCSELVKAHRVLQMLPMHDAVSWTALIGGHAKQGQGEEALKCFDDMLHEGHSLDAVTFACVLKACGNIRQTAKGKEIHDQIVNLGMLEKDIVLGNTLVDMYAKCGDLAKANQVLKELSLCDVVSWNALIAGYAQQGQGEEALKCFEDMLSECHAPDAVTFTCVLKACGCLGATAKGKDVHDKVVSLGILENDVLLGIALVDMYVKCGKLAKAHQVLKELPICHVASWNALIGGYAQHGQGQEALNCFNNMLCEGYSPDAITFACALKACGSIGATAKGEEIHYKIVSLGILEEDIVLGAALVDMYAKCGELTKAHLVLKELPIRDAFSWTALIAGHAKQGQGEEALKCFDDMLLEGHSPDAVTFITVLKACRSIGAAARGKEIHDEVVSLGMLKKDVVLGITLVDMYVKCGELAKAHRVLRELPMHDVVTWTAVIAGHAQQGQGEEALMCFSDLLHKGHFPDAVTFTCVLKACGSIGAATKGKEIHDKIVGLCMLEKDPVLWTTLVDMYVKFGVLAKAQQVFEEVPIRDVVCWNAVISGYAQQGQSVEAINCFEHMQSDGVKPDLISLTIVLNACSHSGLLDEAETYFSLMNEKYGIHPSLEHYCCMIDAFGRAGKFNKALSVFVKMPNGKFLSSYVALLGACHKWAEVKIGMLAFEHAVNLDKHNIAFYVLMADIFTAVGMQRKHTQLR